jgi:ribosomal-protein-alanine N-acetyltransferase
MSTAREKGSGVQFVSVATTEALYERNIEKMKHLGTKELETNRLILRKFELSDTEAIYYNWANDNEVTKYLMWPTHKDISVTSSVLREWVSKYGDDQFYQWAIVLKSNGNDPIGSISIVKMDDSIKMVHVGYCIGKKWWHQGITSEALSAIVRFFFEEVEVNRIESRHDPKNPNSGKVMEKCGLIYEGTVKQGDWNNQGICDYSMYGLVLEDYKKLFDK